MIKNAKHYLETAISVHEAKGHEYKDSQERFNAAMKGLFGSIHLETPKEFQRYEYVTMIVAKLARYVANWHTGHEDSLKDIIVYCAMLLEVDFDAPAQAEIMKRDYEHLVAKAKAHGPMPTPDERRALSANVTPRTTRPSISELLAKVDTAEVNEQAADYANKVDAARGK
jgi:hypothetical protein